MRTQTLSHRCCFIVSFFLFFAAQLFCQNTTSIKKKSQNAVKLFLDFKTFTDNKDFSFIRDSFKFVKTSKHKTIGFYPSLAYTHYKPNGHFTEMAFTFIQFQYRDEIDLETIVFDSSVVDIPTRGEKLLAMKIGLRFDYNIPLFSSENNLFYLGFSSEPIFSYTQTLPYTQANFPSKIFEMKNIVAIMPRFIKNINKKVFVDFNVPISLLSTTYKYENTENPILPTYARRKFTVKSAFFPPNYQFRIGLGVRI